MKSGAAGSRRRIADRAGLLAHPGALVLACALCASSGCASIFGPFGVLLGQGFGEAILLSEVSRSFREDNDRWPRDYEELMTYCEEVDLLTLPDVTVREEPRGIDVDMYMFRELRFTPHPDGALEIDYTIEQTPRADGTRAGWVTGKVTIRAPEDEVKSDP